MTSGSAPVATEMMDTLNRGSRYRIGMVPESLAMNPERLADALKQEGVEFLILENYTQSLPEGFGVPYMVISEGESVTDATRRLNVECPEYGPERRWAQTLREDFAVKAQTPPPMPAEAGEPEQPQAQTQASEPQPAYFNPAPSAMSQGNPASAPAERKPMPKSYLLWAILATIFCCMPAGIVAIVFSTQVSSRYFVGDEAGAEKASNRAQIWIIASIVLSIITNSLYTPLMFLSAAM